MALEIIHGVIDLALLVLIHGGRASLLDRRFASGRLRKIRTICDARPFATVAVQCVLSRWRKLLKDKAIGVEFKRALHELPFLLPLVHQILVLISLDEA